MSILLVADDSAWDRTSLPRHTAFFCQQAQRSTVLALGPRQAAQRWHGDTSATGREKTCAGVWTSRQKEEGGQRRESDTTYL